MAQQCPCDRSQTLWPAADRGLYPSAGKTNPSRDHYGTSVCLDSDGGGPGGTLSSLQLCPDRYRQLDAKQQKQYLEMVRSRAAELTQ